MDKDPYIYRIKSVLKVVDGDTIDAAIDLGFDISLTKRIRLAGVDTPVRKILLLKQNSQILPKSMVEFWDICLLTIKKYLQSIKRNL